MYDSLPLWNLTLTELPYSSCGSITAFNHRERVLWSELFISRHVDPIIMCNSTEIETEQTNRYRIQTVERRCVASKFLLLYVGLKHEPTGGDAPSPERWMPVVAMKHFMTMTDAGLHNKLKTINAVTHGQYAPRTVSSIIANLDRRWQISLNNLVSRFVNSSCVLIVWLRLKRLHIGTIVERWNTHAGRSSSCQQS